MQWGDKINNLTLVNPATPFMKKPLFYCDCGKTKRLLLSTVEDGHVKSCGCLRGSKVVLGVLEAVRHGKVGELTPTGNYEIVETKKGYGVVYLELSCDLGHIRKMRKAEFFRSKFHQCPTCRSEMPIGTSCGTFKSISRPIATILDKSSKSIGIHVKCDCGEKFFVLQKHFLAGLKCPNCGGKRGTKKTRSVE